MKIIKSTLILTLLAAGSSYASFTPQGKVIRGIQTGGTPAEYYQHHGDVVRGIQFAKENDLTIWDTPIITDEQAQKLSTPINKFHAAYGYNVYDDHSLSEAPGDFTALHQLPGTLLDERTLTVTRITKPNDDDFTESDGWNGLSRALVSIGGL